MRDRIEREGEIEAKYMRRDRTEQKEGTEREEKEGANTDMRGIRREINI